MPTFKVVTLGCKVNQYEGQAIRERFESEGFAAAANREPASVVVVNLCTVTATADSKGRKTIRRLARENPGSKLVVTGCVADRNKVKLSALPEVWRVVPNVRKLAIPAIVARDAVSLSPSGECTPATGRPTVGGTRYIGNSCGGRSIFDCTVKNFDGHSRAFVKIQDGCDKGCSYCIVPQVRGKPVSKPFETAIDEIRRLADSGFKEIVISGIHVGSYGNDLQPRRSLLDLLEELARHEVGARLRLSSIEVGEIDGALVDFTANAPLICPHLHVPLQSGSNRILATMNRRYGSERYVEKIAELRARLDTPAITTDVIVGFPGEERCDFERTLEVCRACGFSKIHVFPFSPRWGTRAAEMPGRCESGELRRRLAELKALEHELATSFRERLVGRRAQVLAEGRGSPMSRTQHDPAKLRDPRHGMAPAITLAGFCERYIRTTFQGSAGDAGELVTVRYIGTRPGGLRAEKVTSCV
jgi:threonylcarbamoyladenosine tRNA methylthiotransferase MtaB